MPPYPVPPVGPSAASSEEDRTCLKRERIKKPAPKPQEEVAEELPTNEQGEALKAELDDLLDESTTCWKPTRKTS